jgi:hypothetical protein
MNKYIYVYLFIMGFLCASVDANQVNLGQEFKNYYAPGLRGTVADEIRYAKSMGYRYIGILNSSVPADYATATVAGLKFYYITPVRGSLGTDTYNINTSYDSTATAWYKTYCIHIDTPGTGTHWYDSLGHAWSNDGITYQIMPNYACAGVRQQMIDSMGETMKSYENPGGFDFTCAGFIDDEDGMSLNVWDGNSNLYYYYNQINAAGNTTTVTFAYGTATIEQEGGVNITFNRGFAKLMIEFRNALKAFILNPKWITDTAYMYSSNLNITAEFIRTWGEAGLTTDGNYKAITPDALHQEHDDFAWLNPAAFTGTLSVTLDMAGCNQRNEGDEFFTRQIAIAAGTASANTNWFNRFGFNKVGRILPIPDFQSIQTVWPRLKLLRVLPNWDNLNNMPLSARIASGIGSSTTLTYDSEYLDAKTHIDNHVYYGTHWLNKDIYACFVGDGATSAIYGSVTTPQRTRAVGVYQTNDYLERSANVTWGWTITSVGDRSVVSPKNFTGTTTGYGTVFIVDVEPVSSVTGIGACTSVGTSTGTVQ